MNPSRCGAFLYVRPVFRNLWGGTLLDRCWLPLGHPCPDVLDFLKDFRSKLAPSVNDSKATIQQNKQGLKTIIPSINPNTSVIVV